MTPDFTKLNQLIAARTDWNPSDERNGKRRADDTAIGDETEWIVADAFMQAGFKVEKITGFGSSRLAFPAGYFLREDPEDGDLVLDHFVAFDLLASGPVNFKVKVKLKPHQSHGSGRYYPLDRNRLHRMGKACRQCSSMQHLFVVLDTKRMEAPAHGLFVASMDQLLANASTYVIQHGFGKTNEDAYRIPVTEFRPLILFLEQHNPSKDYTHGYPEQPLPRIDEAA